jgi:hypothetical protein
MVIALDKQIPGFPYEKIIESQDQYIGKGEAAGCFYLAELFQRLCTDLDLEWLSPVQPPSGPAILLGSKNVTGVDPGAYGLHWYIEDGHVMLRDGRTGLVIRSATYDSTLAVTTDYGILTKIHRPTNGGDIVICEGIHSYGTLAVVQELAQNAKWLDSVLTRRFQKSTRKDQGFQIMFRVDVYGGVPSGVSAIDTWVLSP